MKLTFSKIIKHFALVSRHRRQVLINCSKCGLFFRGLVHDLSKYSPAEFFESARYYQGNRSPIGVCRRDKGMSLAWLHHKGKNPHHIEYWFDEECGEHPLMPYEFAVECICDKLAATKTYAGGKFTPDMPMLHWIKYGSRVSGNPKTLAFIERVFSDLSERGERAVLNKKYMKKTYAEVCLKDYSPAPSEEELPLYESKSEGEE